MESETTQSPSATPAQMPAALHVTTPATPSNGASVAAPISVPVALPAAAPIAAPAPMVAAPPVVAVLTPAVAPTKRSPLRILIPLLLVIGAGVGYYLYSTAGEEDTDDAQVAADMVPIGVRVSGQVIKVSIIENQIVKKGALLAELDTADYTARVQQAEAELATAQAQSAAASAQVEVVDANSKGGLMSAKAMFSGSAVGVGSAVAQVAAARASVLRAEAETRKAKIDLDRAKELRSANAVPQERLDTAQIAYESAQAALAQAQAQLAVSRESKASAETRVREARGHLNQSGTIDAQIATAKANAALAQARVRSAEAALDLARLQLSYTHITAPTDGIASKLTIREGQLVNAGQPIVELVPIETYVIANFKETQIGAMHPGQLAEIKIDAFPGRIFHAKVESLSGGTGSSFALLPADNASGNFVKVVQRVPVRLAWQNPPEELKLRAGLSAVAVVHVGR